MAFVLAVVGPLLARLGGRSGVVVALGVLTFFAVMTRLEPPVLRARDGRWCGADPGVGAGAGRAGYKRR